jgi:tetratricopeptide (TPR) repeat protein
MTFRFASACAISGLFAVLTLMPAQAGTPGFEEASLSGNYLAGRTAGKARDMDAAAKYFGQALRDDPNNPVLIERAFFLALSAGKIRDAEGFASQVLSFNSQHRLARIVLGLRDLRLKRYKMARENFAKSAYTPVGELTAGLLMAWTFAADGKTAEALKALDKLDSNDAFANFKSFHAGLIADFGKMPLRAEQFYKKAYENAGSSLRVVMAYGSFLERTGRPEEARKIYLKFLEASDRNPLIGDALERIEAKQKTPPFINSALQGVGEALFSLASALSDDQGLDVALIYAQLALTVESDASVAHTLLGDIYEDMNLYDKAIEAYRAIPPKATLWPNAEIEIAINLQRLEKTDEAKAGLKKLIARHPANYEALMTLGNIQRNNEEFADAAKTYTQALALVANPGKEHWTAFYYRGIAFERTKEWDKAEADFRKALALEPDQPLVLNYLGYSMIEKKINLQEALGMVRKAVELKPNDGYIVDSLGWAYYHLGDYEEAVKHLERAVELKPADPVIADHLGDAYWRTGRTLEANFQWQHAKDNKPEPENLKVIDAKLRDGLPAEPAVKPAENLVKQNNG